MHLQLSAPIIAILALSACAPHPVDRRLTFDGAPSPNHQADLQACKVAALNYRNSDLDRKVAATAGVGALVGAADAAEDGDTLEGALAGALIGGVVGKAESNTVLRQEQRDALIRCMQGRGHKVIG